MPNLKKIFCSSQSPKWVFIFRQPPPATDQNPAEPWFHNSTSSNHCQFAKNADRTKKLFAFFVDANLNASISILLNDFTKPRNVPKALVSFHMFCGRKLECISVEDCRVKKLNNFSRNVKICFTKSEIAVTVISHFSCFREKPILSVIKSEHERA